MIQLPSCCPPSSYALISVPSQPRLRLVPLGKCPALDPLAVPVSEDLAAGGHDHVSIPAVLKHTVVIDGFPGFIYQLHLFQLLPIHPGNQRPDSIPGDDPSVPVYDDIHDLLSSQVFLWPCVTIVTQGFHVYR